jgi:hypothetical protein
LTTTPAGFFAASDRSADMLTVVRGAESYPVVQFYDQLCRPDLVEEALRGDPDGKLKKAATQGILTRLLDGAPAPPSEPPDKRGEGIFGVLPVCAPGR